MKNKNRLQKEKLLKKMEIAEFEMRMLKKLLVHLRKKWTVQSFT